MKSIQDSRWTLTYFISVFSVVNIGILPTAPRGAVDIDYSTVPNNPPFVAHIANLSFEIDDESLRRIFADLNVRISTSDFISVHACRLAQVSSSDARRKP